MMSCNVLPIMGCDAVDEGSTAPPSSRANKGPSLTEPSEEPEPQSYDAFLEEMRSRAKAKKLASAYNTYRPGSGGVGYESLPASPLRDSEPAAAPEPESAAPPYTPEDSLFQEVSPSFAAALEARSIATPTSPRRTQAQALLDAAVAKAASSSSSPSPSKGLDKNASPVSGLYQFGPQPDAAAAPTTRQQQQQDLVLARAAQLTEQKLQKLGLAVARKPEALLVGTGLEAAAGAAAEGADTAAEADADADADADAAAAAAAAPPPTVEDNDVHHDALGNLSLSDLAKNARLIQKALAPPPPVDRHLARVGTTPEGRPILSGVRSWADGMEYAGQMVGGKRYGRGRVAYPNGDVYDGGWEQDKKHGQGRYTWADGSVYEGGYEMGLRHGVGKMQDPSGSSYEGEFQHDVKAGRGLFLEFRDGKLAKRWRGVWEDDKLHHTEVDCCCG